MEFMIENWKSESCLWPLAPIKTPINFAALVYNLQVHFLLSEMTHPLNFGSAPMAVKF